MQNVKEDESSSRGDCSCIVKTAFFKKSWKVLQSPDMNHESKLKTDYRNHTG